MSAPLTVLRRVGGMLVIASLCALLTGPALASTPDRRAASSVASKTTISTAGSRSVAWADAPLALATKVARGVTYGGSVSGDDPIVIVLSHDGTSVRRISTRFEATCSDGPRFMVFVDGPLDRTITAAGRFIGMSSGTDDLGSGVTARSTSSLKGRVKGKKITGSFRFHVDQVNAAGAVLATCDQTATFEAISARGRVFGGHTSQGGPVVVELAAKRKAVRRFRIGWQASCTPPPDFQVGETLINFPLTSGRFGDDFTTQNFAEPTGAKTTDSYSLRGKIQRTRVAGTLRVKTTEADATGATIATCDSGAISYTAGSG